MTVRPEPSRRVMYALDVTIIVRLAASPLPEEPAESTFVATFDVEAAGVDNDEIAAALFDISSEAGGLGGFTIDEKRSLTEWGASGGAWEYLVHLAAGLDEELIGAAVAMALTKIATVLKTTTPARPLDREQALASATFAVLRQNPRLERGSLTVFSEEHDIEADRWAFTFRPGDGWAYEAEIGWHGELPGVVRVGRSRINGER